MSVLYNVVNDGERRMRKKAEKRKKKVKVFCVVSL